MARSEANSNSRRRWVKYSPMDTPITTRAIPPAAAGGMALVVIGVSVGLYFTQRRREFEFASLRAMGSSPRQVTGTLLTEQGAMIAFAVVAGAGLGFLVVRLMMPYFGKAVGAAFPAPILVVDWRWLAIYGTAIAAAT